MQQDRFHSTVNRTLTIILLVCAIIAGMYMIKVRETRTWGMIVVLASFLLLYTYIVKRRNTPKK